MSTSTENKRRSIGGTHGHRTSPSSPGSSSRGKNSMPALPPRAVTSSMEEPHQGGSSSGSLKEQDPKERETGKASSKEIRERDDKIERLERELQVMEREFTRELDRLSQNESETTTFWQSKHSALNQQYLRTDTELRLLRSEVEVREAERDELRQGWEVLRRELKERDEEIRGLRSQVRGLKEFVSTSTRTDGSTSDEVFGNGMARLGNGLQNWIMINFRRSQLDLGKADESTMAEVAELVPMYEELTKVYFLQSLVSSILVEMVFEAYYVGLSHEQTEQFRKMEDMLRSFTGADEAVNQWRSATLTLIRREAPQQHAAATTSSVLDRINRIMDAITTATPSETRDSGLRVLINNSIELARLLAVQKAVLRVTFPRILPHQRILFDADTMEDIGGEDEESLASGSREIACVAFPGVIKHGDESGGQLQYRNVITKARVLCRSED
ncbi:uncharacterized protein F5Z01DRAFT_482312 [Emericellopsis atlantica]|uniref:Involucrin repeat protein n=1 Tax=Emericellopsis atlantica TaxID=2614577 RepID=A0A9P8CTC6_9HYPO|nr:uncharacterized protein F5Z01DRAFT_482312 [Emericellopsis atlantica]KAG9256681.1 hypothetical protein F5Z01DRAFT_482312 [Emericellopsis atlantica]